MHGSPNSPARATDNPNLVDSTLIQEATALVSACDAFTSRDKWKASTLTVQFLLGRATELALKAFLIRAGVTEAQLRGRSMGHNLSGLWSVSVAKGLALPDAEPTDAQLVDLLNENYSKKLFEYPLVQGYVIVATAPLRRFVHRLLKAVFTNAWGADLYEWTINKNKANSSGLVIPPDVHYEESNIAEPPVP